MRLLRRFLEDTSGNVAILSAAAMSLTLVAAAFAIDEASLYSERRMAQAAVDLAAIAAARTPEDAFAVVHASLVDAGMIESGLSEEDLSEPTIPIRLMVVAGRYDAAGADPEDRFVAGQAPANAVRVWFQRAGTLYFARPWADAPPMSVAAVAHVSPVAAFSVGSRLAALNGGVANAVLNGLLGTSVTLSVADYNALLDARVDLFDYLDALGGELGITAGTYDDILAASADHGALAQAAADLLDGAEGSAAQLLAGSIGNNGAVPLAKLFDLGDWGRLDIGSGGSIPLAEIGILETLVASAAISNGSHQVALNLGAAVPGLIGIAMTLAIGEPAQFSSWYRIGGTGEVVRTAQVRLRLVTTLGGGAVLLGAQVKVPLYLELAYAEAMLEAATCPENGDDSGSATILARPGVARLTLGNVDDPAFGDFSAAPVIGAAKLIDLLLLKVTGSAHAEVGALAPVMVHFSASEIADGVVKTAQSSGYVGSLTMTLLGSLDLDVTVLGLGLASPSAIASAVRTLVTPVAPVLDSIVDTSLDVLGLSLGEADVRVYGTRCTQAVLVG